jgi:hypothetical protein
VGQSAVVHQVRVEACAAFPARQPLRAHQLHRESRFMVLVIVIVIVIVIVVVIVIVIVISPSLTHTAAEGRSVPRVPAPSEELRGNRRPLPDVVHAAVGKLAVDDVGICVETSYPMDVLIIDFSLPTPLIVLDAEAKSDRKHCSLAYFCTVPDHLSNLRTRCCFPLC